MPTPHEREAALFALAAEKPDAERDAFLQVVCGQDATLLERLRTLLDPHKEPAAGLADSAAAPTSMLSVGANDSQARDESVGATLGRYKLLERVGEGGCGVVYVAEQTHPVRRRVALKVIKLGMDTREVIARFEAERQALAMMDHPNIAKVLDAGTTETGRPYFVMELVRGIRITDYCDQENLSTNDRLDLFIKVCQAIQHAHQKGIIHRDIKPSNILVTLHDGLPVPKVIDFGIAKATEGRLTEATVYTQLHQFIGTPAYMSPEQAEMSGLDIDTRSDIYSLGVLLYELLAGSTPFDPKELMASGIDAMRKTIREKEPMRPSTRLATLNGEILTTTAKSRSADTSKLLHQLRGDLDWVVMKCLEKDRTRRYETANGLAADLKRHLNNEPVVARPPSAAYRFQKAFRRNKLIFAAATAVVLALIAGLSLAALGWRQTRLERDRALQARAGEEAQRKEAQASAEKAKLAEAAQMRLREQAEAQALIARRSAYSSDMSQAQQMLRVNNLGQAQRLLERQRPSPGEIDLRGWEWRYLWSQTRADEHDVLVEARTGIYRLLCFSADGRLLARRAGGERLTVIDMVSRRIVFQPPYAFQPAFANHDPRLAFIIHTNAENDVIKVVDTTAFLPNMSAPKGVEIRTPWNDTLWLGFTGDDQRLITVSANPNRAATDLPPFDLTAWDPVSGMQLWQTPIEFSQKWSNRRNISTSRDGSAIVFLLGGGGVNVVESKDGRSRFTALRSSDGSYVTTFSPDSSMILMGSGLSTIQLLDARTGEALDAMEGHSAYITDLVFTPDGTRLISSSADQTIRVWDWAARKTVSVFRCPPGVLGMALAADGRTLATRGVDGSIALWDVAKSSQRASFQTLPGKFWRAVFSADSKSIVGIEEKGGAAIWDSGTLKETRRLFADSTESSILSPDGATLLRRNSGDGELQIWDVKSGQETKRVNPATQPKSRYTRNGKFIVIPRGGFAAGSVLETWDTTKWERKGSVSLNFNRIETWPGIYTTSLPNSYGVMADGALRLFDASKPGDAPRIIPMENGLYDFSTSPDGRIGVGSFKGGTVRLWNMNNLTPLETMKTFLLDAKSVGFSPDGTRFAVSSTGMEAVKLWDAENRHEVLTLSGGGELKELSFSPDGRHLMGISSDDILHLWSAPTLEEINAIEAKEKARSSEP